MPARRRTNRTAKKRSTPDWAERFFRELKETANISAACQAAKVGRRTVYDRRDSDEAFAAQMAEALDEAVDGLELEARRRAMEGVSREKGVFYQGAQVATEVITEYSDTLMIFLLKAHRPEKYRERHEHQHAGPGGGPIPVKASHDITGDLTPYANVLRSFLQDAGGGDVPPDRAGQPLDPPQADAETGPVPAP